MTGLMLERATVMYQQSGRAFAALDDVSVRLEPGAFLVIIGANGAGKSTMAGAIAGNVALSAGRIRLGDRDITRIGEHRRAGFISRVVQDPRLGTAADLTVEENLALALSRGRRRSPLRLALRTSVCRDFAERLQHYGRGLDLKLKVPASDLSGGQRQVVALAMAVLRAPQLLVLDEHTSALDPEMGARVMQQTRQVVSELGLTTLMITHNLKYAVECGDRLAIMNRGKIVRYIEGTAKAELTETNLIDEFRSAVGDGAITDEILG